MLKQQQITVLFLLILSNFPVYSMQLKTKSVREKEIMLELPQQEFVMLDKRSALLSKLVVAKLQKKDSKKSTVTLTSTTQKSWLLLLPYLKELSSILSVHQQSERKKLLKEFRTSLALVAAESLNDLASAAEECKVTELKTFITDELHKRAQKLKEQISDDKCAPLVDNSFKEYVQAHLNYIQSQETGKTEPAKEAPKGLCTICNQEPESQLCGKCGLQSYCSADCQKRDWIAHKINCLKKCSVCENKKPAIRCPECFTPFCSVFCKEKAAHTKKCSSRKIIVEALKLSFSPSYEDLFSQSIKDDLLDVFNALLAVNLVTIKKGVCSAQWALHEAAINKRPAMVSVLLERGIALNNANSLGSTEMHCACKGGSREVVELLFNKGSSITARDAIQGALPLHEAAEEGHSDIVDFLLLKKPTTKNTPTNEGFSALLLVCDRGNFELARRLIEHHKVDLTAVTKLNRNALHLACRGGSLPLVRYLVEEKGFSVNAITSHDETPIFFAANAGFVEIVSYLRSKDAQLTVRASNNLDALFMACSKGHVNVVNFFKEQCNVNLKEVRGARGATLMHWACSQGYIGMIDYLLGEGLLLTIGDQEGFTPIQLACKASQTGVVEHLSLKHGIDIALDDLKLMKKTVLERLQQKQRALISAEQKAVEQKEGAL